jgi:mannan endo-1,4-beta-mannosidase
MSSTLYVENRYLFDNADNKLILRGINLPLLDDWDFPSSDTLSEIEKTGANAVRIQWYVDYGNPARPPYSIADLDSFLNKCRVNQIIPIVMLADYTCQGDTNLVNTKLIPWWTDPGVKAVLLKHERYLIINLANELGHYRWAESPIAALDDFKNAYKVAIISIRNAGLDIPIMIDAPDCGTSMNAFTTIGQELIDHDPKKNILLSVHAYWAGYDGTSEIAKAYKAQLPIIFGEIANKQAEIINGQTIECYYDLDGSNENHLPSTMFRYQSLLDLLTQHEIGWLAWSWWKDSCTSRQMTSDGTYVNLTPYGNDVVNNESYGLRFHAVRTPTLP